MHTPAAQRRLKGGRHQHSQIVPVGTGQIVQLLACHYASLLQLPEPGPLLLRVPTLGLHCWPALLCLLV